MKDVAKRVVRQLQDAGFTAYFAGGGVRDQLLGRTPKDLDIATSANPEQVQALFPRVTGLVGKCFGVVHVLEDGCTFEVATFRRDGAYTNGRRPDYVTFTTAEEDAHRRDFTVNGLFWDPMKEKLIDFVGGEADLRAGILRCIGRPEDRFCEDKLRVLRAVRFAATLKRPDDSWFEIEPATWEAICRLAPRLWVNTGQDDATGQPGWGLSAERVRDELDKIWTGPRPERGLDLLDQSGLLEVVLPEIHALHGVEQPPEWHPEGDVYVHTRLMLSHLHGAPLELALAVLFHDVAKKTTFAVDETGRIRFHGHEEQGAVMTEEIMRRLRYSNDQIDAVTEMVRYHMQFKDVTRMKVSTLKRMMARPHFDLELELHRIDCLSSHGDIGNYEILKSKQEEFRQEDIKPPRLVNGRDLLALGIPPGRAIGQILEQVEEAQLEGTVQTHAEAMALVRRLAAR